ncbi:hypothetical protein E2I00_015844, partial [Balaenoptera physalus]
WGAGEECESVVDTLEILGREAALVLLSCSCRIINGGLLIKLRDSRITMQCLLCFALTVFLGCWHGVENEEAPSEQSVSVAVSHVHTFKADSSNHMAHPCDLCGPILKDILHLDEHQETHHGLKPYTCGACGRQFWFSANFDQHQKLYNVEKLLRGDKGRASFVKNCRACEEPHLSEKPFACEEEQKNFQ